MEYGDYDHDWQAQDLPQHLRKTSVSVIQEIRMILGNEFESIFQDYGNRRIF